MHLLCIYIRVRYTPVQVRVFCLFRTNLARRSRCVIFVTRAIERTSVRTLLVV